LERIAEALGMTLHVSFEYGVTTPQVVISHGNGKLWRFCLFLPLKMSTFVAWQSKKKQRKARRATRGSGRPASKSTKGGIVQDGRKVMVK